MLLKLHEKLPDFNVDRSIFIWHLKQIGKVKKLGKWVPCERTTNQNVVILKCHLLLFCAIVNHFLIGLWCAMKNGFYTTTGDDQLSDWTEEKLQSTSQSQTCTQERWCSLFGELLPVWSLQLSESWQTITSETYAQPFDEMHWRLTRVKHNWATELNCTENCNACNWCWSTEWAQFSSTATPDHTSHNQHWATKILPRLPYSPNRLPTNYHFLKHLDNFLQGKCFHNQQEAENAFQEFVESQRMDFYTTGINQFIACCQKCVDCIDTYFD